MKTPLVRLRELGLRVTTGRLRVLQTVEHASTRGMGVEQVYHELVRSGKPLSLASVYRIMKDLTEEGIFSRSWSGEADDIKYAYWLRSEADAGGDNKIVCGRCQRTVRIDNPALENDILRQAQKGGLTPGSLQFTIQVTCMECAVAQKDEPPPS